MMKNKKLEWTRLLIFVCFAFLLNIILSAVCSKGFRIALFDEFETYASLISFLSLFGMLTPSVAVVLTRVLTKEGMKNSYIAFPKKGSGKYVIMALLTSPCINFCNLLCFWLLLLGTPFADTFTFAYMEEKIPALLMMFAQSVLLIPHTFGEEWGWRGYMMPKLFKLTNRPMAIVLGGVIWGLWHTPMTVIGHNFGTGYPFFPWTGILLMCILCVLMNTIMTFITEKTQSIFPSCFLHGIYNNINIGIMASLFLKEDILKGLNLNSLQSFGCTLIPLAVVNLIFAFMMIRNMR